MFVIKTVFRMRNTEVQDGKVNVDDQMCTKWVSRKINLLELRF